VSDFCHWFCSQKFKRESARIYDTSNILIMFLSTDSKAIASMKPRASCLVHRSLFAKKSKAALKREAAAIRAFDALRAAETPEKITTWRLLTPNIHLTSACYSTFRKHVFSFPGWSCDRRVATVEEKSDYKETRKGKTYWTNVTFNPNHVADESPCETRAFEMFHAFRLQTGTPTTKVSTVLLTPLLHLNTKGYKSFRKQIRTYEGWYCSRRVATLAEKFALGCASRNKTASYFVSVEYDPLLAAAVRKMKQERALSTTSPTTVGNVEHCTVTTENATPVALPPCKKVKLANHGVLGDVSNTESLAVEGADSRRITP
jgi:hypothetical protein